MILGLLPHTILSASALRVHLTWATHLSRDRNAVRLARVLATSALPLGLRIKFFRRRARITQAELGRRSGFSGEYVKKIEAGRVPPAETLRKIATALELDPRDHEGLFDAWHRHKRKPRKR